jgi:hypothetical protein
MIRKRSIARLYRIAAGAIFGVASACALPSATVLADGIEPGLWQVTSRTQTGGVIGPPHESSKCLTAQEVSDLAATFAPASRTINSTCAPIEKDFNGARFTWRLTCKGQLDMELTGEFNFDGPRHYTAIVRSKASMAGTPMVDSQENIEARWLSPCPQ